MGMKKNAQAQVIGWHYKATEEASAASPVGFRLWEICPTWKYAENVIKRQEITGAIIAPISDHVAIYIKR